MRSLAPLHHTDTSQTRTNDRHCCYSCYTPFPHIVTSDTHFLPLSADLATCYVSSRTSSSALVRRASRALSACTAASSAASNIPTTNLGRRSRLPHSPKLLSPPSLSMCCLFSARSLTDFFVTLWLCCRCCLCITTSICCAGCGCVEPETIGKCYGIDTNVC